jgi:hypothetical protein
MAGIENIDADRSKEISILIGILTNNCRLPSREKFGFLERAPMDLDGTGLAQ